MSDIGSGARLATAEDAIAAVLALDEDLLTSEEVADLRSVLEWMQELRQAMP